MWGYRFGPMGPWTWLWSLFWLVLLGVGVWALVRWASNPTAASGPEAGPAALEILRQRYARRDRRHDIREDARALESVSPGRACAPIPRRVRACA